MFHRKSQQIIELLEKGNVKAVQNYIANGFDVNCPLVAGKRLLHLASEKCPAIGKAMLEMLLAQKKIEIDAHDDQGFTSLMYAAKANSRIAIELLILHGANYKLTVTNTGNTIFNLLTNSHVIPNVREFIKKHEKAALSVILLPDKQPQTPTNSSRFFKSIKIVTYEDINLTKLDSEKKSTNSHHLSMNKGGKEN